MVLWKVLRVGEKAPTRVETAAFYLMSMVFKWALLFVGGY